MMGRVDNPVLTKEMRTRMRGTRAYWVLFVYVMVLAVVLFITYLAWYDRNNGQLISPGLSPVGRQLFLALFTAQAVMVTLITPALTSGMLTIEREQRTFELLMLTMLRPRQVIAGKLLSAFGFVILLLTASLPLAGICFLLGGVSPGEVISVYALLGVSALFYGGIGILLSSMVRTTAVATAATYMAVLFLMGVTGTVGAGGRQVLFSAVNPIAAVYTSLLAAPFYTGHLPTWTVALLVNGLAALLASAGAVHRLEEGVSDRPGLLRWLTFLLFVVLAVGIVGNVLGATGTPSAGTAHGLTAFLAGTLLAFLALMAVIFCSGDAAETLGPPRQERAPRRGIGRLVDLPLFAGGYRTGPAYVVFLYLVAATVLLTGPLLAPAWGAMLDVVGPMLLVMLAPLLFTVELTRLFSVATGSRYTGAALTFFAITMLCLVPLVNYIGWDSSLNPRHQILWETLYLNPAIALISLSTAADAWKSGVPGVWAGQSLTWAVTCALYVGMALACAGAVQWHAKARAHKGAGPFRKA